MAAILVNNHRQRNYQRARRVARTFRDRTMLLDTLDDGQLIRRYRMDRNSLFLLLESIRPDITSVTQRSHALTPQTKMLVTLRYFSKGGFYSEIGDLHGISVASVSRTVDEVVDAIVDNMSLIHFPRTREQERVVKAKFFDIARFPRVTGCIDGTLVPIIRPKADEELAYVCRKGYHALNVQAICDAQLRFTSVVCKFPGSTHDSFILQNSAIGHYCETGMMDGWLLGDSGYACRPWLLTPILNPRTPSEERFNDALCKTRNTIERAFGLLKSRFRCLHKTSGCLPFKPSKCHKVVYAICQLHNFCINRRLPTPPMLDDEDDEDGNAPQPQQIPALDGIGVRNRLIREYFA